LQYHDIRHQEKIKKVSEADTDTLKKEILSRLEIRVNEIANQIHDYFYEIFDEQIGFRVEDYGVDVEEYDSIIDEANDFSSENLEAVVSSCLNIIKNDLKNLTAEELMDIQEKYGNLIVVDALAEKFITDYIIDNVYEITAEVTDTIIDKFLHTIYL